MKHHKIIHDEVKLDNFIHKFLPNLQPNEKFYACLFARKKYSNVLIHSNDKTQLRRMLVTKSNLKSKLKELETPIGSYQLKSITAPQESLVVYINPNPRDMVKTAYESILKLTTMLRDDAIGYNPVQEVMSCAQRSKGRKVYIDFDIDLEKGDDELTLVNSILNCVNKEAVSFLKTRGGFHVLVKKDMIDPIYKKTFYKDIISIKGHDQVGNILMPVPGCTQGGYVPRFVQPVFQ